MAQVDVPPLGYRQIRIRKVPAMAAPSASAPHATGETLENEHVRVRFDASGTVGILDKDTGAQVFRGGNKGLRAVVLDDYSDTWSHKVRAYDKEVGQFHRTGLDVIENGPLRALMCERLTFGTSTLTLDWILYAGSRHIEVRASLDWHEYLKMLKFSFPVDIAEPHATYEVAYGAMQRATNDDEDPGQRWIDLSGTQGEKSYGLSVINDAKYGYSVSGNDMRVSIARSAVYANHEPRDLKPGVDYQWMDQGVQTFKLELIPHTGSWQDAGVVRAAEELVSEIPIVYQGIHPGTRKQADSFLSVDAPNIVVEAVKQSEDGDDLIVRSYETAGKASTTTLTFGFSGAKWTGNYHPFEIKTLRLNRQTGQIRVVDALEQ